MPTVDINESKQTLDSYPSQVLDGEIPAGKTFKIETTPSGQEIARGIVPAGKKWRYKIALTIIEEDV